MSILNRVFDAVFVINLDRAPDRLKKIDAELRRHGVRYRRIQAVDGKQLSPEEIKENTTLSCGLFCTKGAIGCALSHRKAWETTVREGLQQVLVLEDDAHFGEDFDRRFAVAWRHVPRDWDLVYLGCITGCGDRDRYTLFDWGMTGMYLGTSLIKDGKLPNLHGRVNDHIAVPDSASATHAYAITGRAAKKMLSRLQRVAGVGHIDQLITYRIGRDLKKYAFTDGTLVTQSLQFDASTIGGGGSPYAANMVLDLVPLNHRGVRAGWMLSEPIMGLGNDVLVAGWQIIFLALGWWLGLSRFKWFATALVLDSLVFSGKKGLNTKQLLFNIGLFALGGWIRHRFSGR